MELWIGKVLECICMASLALVREVDPDHRKQALNFGSSFLACAWPLGMCAADYCRQTPAVVVHTSQLAIVRTTQHC